ncbi:hypothetical protein SODALDRAFT_332687 [Sodiomyces alkalinus F11]|uniref:Uncharacterized protein n=1 Tax=Sodiomyces alkalinus (strain CBS 110278 / VKM F-3762 / F11) TaxID=1314773 RepID=A0A3N2PXI9_SODAK|nr:hypothetical protein SODALDRAFT_332687 [Sodiomyces alkalinus F11]ROT39250.1 hypothetical protein SODALDRAFT_332687 [Sodiomyces alkalinus F11]
MSATAFHGSFHGSPLKRRYPQRHRILVLKPPTGRRSSPLSPDSVPLFQEPRSRPLRLVS